MDKPVLVLGATGYVGGRLVPLLLNAGYSVRAVSRSIQKLKNRPWASHSNVELIAADVTDADALEKAITGCGTAFYLVHSMNPKQKDFEKTDRLAAQTMRAAADAAGLDRIIYLSGLGASNLQLSKHLRSRAEVAAILREGKTPVTVLRAAMIIGSGSASFEILRYLVERLPVMITPKWIDTPVQPIAIRNILNYLVGCLTQPGTIGRTFDVGGPDVLTYRKLMMIYKGAAGLSRRWIIPVPVFTPRLSAYWIHLVTPVPAAIARPLAEGLRSPVVCQEQAIQELIPQELLSAREAIELALQHVRRHQVETHWTDAGSLPPVESVYPGDPNWSGGTVYKEQRQICIFASKESVWEAVLRIGGKNGWYYGDWLWRLRGFFDRLLGGVGHSRGRRSPDNLLPGDALDFWRVLEVHPGSQLKLLAEMKLPGDAILSFDVQPRQDGETNLTQTAWFVPHGLMGLIYWYVVLPLHTLIFKGMLRNIARSASKSVTG